MLIHADYPHEPGTLYDCPACELIMAEEAEEAAPFEDDRGEHDRSL